MTCGTDGRVCPFSLSLSPIVTGLPKEWQQTLQDNGVTRQEQEKNPEAVSENRRPKRTGDR
jgi:hypothetical protein